MLIKSRAKTERAKNDWESGEKLTLVMTIEYLLILKWKIYFGEKPIFF